jgi:hypothetical protein
MLGQVIIGLIEVHGPSGRSHHTSTTTCSESVEQLKRKRISVAGLLFYQVVYPAIIQTAFGMFSCTSLLDGSRTFSLAPHLDCDSDEAYSAKAVAAASLALWGVAFPIFLGLLIHRKGSDPHYSFTIVSYGYKSSLRFWETWECIKKFVILLIITFLQFAPELAAAALLIFLCCALTISAEAEPFVSALINKAHLGCDFLIFVVLVTGLLSASADRTGEQEVDALSIVVVSYAACLLTGLAAILVIEIGSSISPGGALNAVWEQFLHSSPAHVVVAITRRVTKRFSRRFSGVAPQLSAEDSATDGR